MIFCVLENGTLDISDEDLLLKKLKVFVYDLLTNKPASGESWSRAYNKTEEKQAYLETLDFDDTRIDNIDKEPQIKSFWRGTACSPIYGKLI